MILDRIVHGAYPVFYVLQGRNRQLKLKEEDGERMKKLTELLVALVMVFGLVASAQATLRDMGDGTVYDTDTQLSWLKNANTAGAMTWDQAHAWVVTLNSGSGFAGFTNWRLPTTTEPDATCSYQYDAGGGFPLQGYGYNCTGNEMAHLFYVSLGNSAGSLTNTGPFTNLQGYYVYWLGTEFAPDPTATAWSFLFDIGFQNGCDKSTSVYAWAVRPGARSQSQSKPVPASGLLSMIGLGLAGLMIFGIRSRRATT
jgi:hypothetical protein